MKYQNLIHSMTVEEKIALCSGADFFSTKAFARCGIPAIRMADGPHGLRKQVAAEDNLGINDSVPATAFPTASLSACSWDRDLLREMGAAIGAEAQQEGISIVLGPGANIKRNPLCGRNFEYFSEDPLLAGELAASWITGLQSVGVGASLKHFAGNNQENERMTSDSLMDERTLREIYLPAFERAVKAARPATVMCAYNKLNGVYCSDNRALLRDILRQEWGFAGVVVTDWGALHDRIPAFEAGLDLEMPGSQGYFDEAVAAAVRGGLLAEERLDECVDRLLDLIFTCAGSRKPGFRCDAQAHHQLARKIARESAVLLKNEEQILPIRPGQKIALIGALAKEPRYQGTGSSHIRPTRLDSICDGLEALGLNFCYYPGYELKGTTTEALLAEAADGARNCDLAVIVAGLPEEYESEGFDRASLDMPDSHNQLILRVAAANPNTVVVLVGGAPVEMPWLSTVKAVLNMYLAGQGGGLAAADLLSGMANPSGKLAESYPLCYEDVPSAGCYETGGKQAQYREGLLVGYRFYDLAAKTVLFPFGHGLSYTTFEYSHLSLSTSELTEPFDLALTCTVKNTGSVGGAEIVQVYVGEKDPPVYRPEKELKAFAKVFLEPGEAHTLRLALDARSFAFFVPGQQKWVVPAGAFEISIGASSRDIRLRGEINVLGQAVPAASCPVPGWYRQPAGAVTQADFEDLLGHTIDPVKASRPGEFTLENTFDEMRGNFFVRQVIKGIEATIAKPFGGPDYSNPTFRMMMASSMGTPLKNLSQLSPNSMPQTMAQGIVHMANGQVLKGLLSIIKG